MNIYFFKLVPFVTIDNFAINVIVREKSYRTETVKPYGKTYRNVSYSTKTYRIEAYHT